MMAWKIELSKQARKDLKALSKSTQIRIVRFIDERLAKLDNPKLIGKSLSGQKYKSIWCYRVGDHRLLATIANDVITVTIIEIGHRREVYR